MEREKEVQIIKQQVVNYIDKINKNEKHCGALIVFHSYE